MKLFHVVAMARNRVIGKDNRLPWHFPSDLKHFKRLTSESTLLMGRKTFESIGRPLPNRENFVLSSQSQPDADHLRFFNNLDEALSQVRTEKCFVIGGARVYGETLERAEGLYVTHIHADFEGDVSYPEIPPSFREKERSRLQEKPVLEVVFYERG